MSVLQELQAYVDERARRHSVAVEAGWPGPAVEVQKARREEAMEIGRYIAKRIAEQVP